MARIPTVFHLEAFLAKVEKGKKMLRFPKKQIIFAQGDATAEFWMNLQKTYELRLAGRALSGKVRNG